jgi:hypothetical protein
MESIPVIRANAEAKEFCIGRMVTKFGLLTIGVTSGLRAAKARIEQLSESSPGDYVVFLRNTGRVIVKTSSALPKRRSFRQCRSVKCQADLGSGSFAPVNA